MRAYKITSTDATNLTGENYTASIPFTPFQDGIGNWYLPESQVDNCTNITWMSFCAGLSKCYLMYGKLTEAQKDAMAWQSNGNGYNFNAVPDIGGVDYYISELEAETTDPLNEFYPDVSVLILLEYVKPVGILPGGGS